MKVKQLEFHWSDDKSEANAAPASSDGVCELVTPPAEPVGEGSASLEELRTPQPPKVAVAEPDEPNETAAAVEGGSSRWANYGPNHPWYYLPQGDNQPPLPAGEIPAGQGVGRFLEREVPKDPFKRIKKLRELLDIEQHDLSIDIERYQEIAEKGVAALSRYDREIAHGGNEELARASALALKYNHIAWGKGRVAWLEEELGKPAPTRGRSRRKRGD